MDPHYLREQTSETSPPGSLLELFEVDPELMKLIFNDRFKGRDDEDPIMHLRKFDDRCNTLKMSNVSLNIFKAKLFPFSLDGEASNWMLTWPNENFNSWFNIKASFVEKFGPTNIIAYNRSVIFAFKQWDDEILTDAWERYRELIYGIEHGLRDWMIIHTFYSSLTMRSISLLDNACGRSFMNLPPSEAHVLLDSMLIEIKINDSVLRAGLFYDPFDDYLEKEETTMHDETTKVEELKMLNDVVTEPLLDLDKCSLSEPRCPGTQYVFL